MENWMKKHHIICTGCLREILEMHVFREVKWHEYLKYLGLVAVTHYLFQCEYARSNHYYWEKKKKRKTLPRHHEDACSWHKLFSGRSNTPGVCFNSPRFRCFFFSAMFIRMYYMYVLYEYTVCVFTYPWHSWILIISFLALDSKHSLGVIFYAHYTLAMHRIWTLILFCSLPLFFQCSSLHLLQIIPFHASFVHPYPRRRLLVV